MISAVKGETTMPRFNSSLIRAVFIATIVAVPIVVFSIGSFWGTPDNRKVFSVTPITRFIPAEMVKRCDTSIPGAIIGGGLGSWLLGTPGAIGGALIGSQQGKCKSVRIPSSSVTIYVVHLDDGSCGVSFINWEVGTPAPGWMRDVKGCDRVDSIADVVREALKLPGKIPGAKLVLHLLSP